MRLDLRVPLQITPRLLTAALLLLLLLAMGGVLRNQWVQDDTGVIRDNALVQSVDGVWKAFAHPYWPGDRKELYRPLAIASFALQWAVADGAPWVFRVVNLLAYAAAVLAVWTLLRRMTSTAAAWIGAALFAIHPVHVEAVAVSVNQGETLVAALLVWAAILYLDLREGRLPAGRARAGILLLFIPALFIKEHALVLPGLLAALELTLLAGRGSWRERWRSTWGLYAALFLIGGLFWVVRGRVLGGGAGTDPIEILAGLDASQRALTMLGVVPEWLRLLLWPAHLQADWAPLEYVPYSGWSLRETVGLIGLAALVLALFVSWGRRPRVAFALLWLAVALFPVSNLLIPTGVMIAERTLFLASVAVAIIAADLSEAALPLRWLQQGWRRTAAALSLGALLATGAVASAIRMVTWHDRVLFLASALVDAPLSYRVWLSYGMMLHEHADTLAADSATARAMTLHPNDLAPFLSLAWKLQREGGHCRPAFSLYRQMLEKSPGRGDFRIGYIACATWLGYYDVAARAAREGIARRIDAGYLRQALGVIDSAAATRAPAETVRLPELPGGWVTIGHRTSRRPGDL
jgi:hypothetical protein